MNHNRPGPCSVEREFNSQGRKNVKLPTCLVGCTICEKVKSTTPMPTIDGAQSPVYLSRKEIKLNSLKKSHQESVF